MIAEIRLEVGDRIVLQDKRIGRITGRRYGKTGSLWSVALEGVLDNYVVEVKRSGIYGLIVGVANDSATAQLV